jgi:tyrosine-protein phosphatase SIW14
VRSSVGTWLLALLALASASAAEPRVAQEVVPGIYRSAQPDAAALRAARERGVRTVVVLRSEVPEPERSAAAALGLEVVHVPMDGTKMPSIEEVDRALEVVLDPSKRPVLVHCAHGEERTGAVVAAYRVVVEGWEPAAAEKEAIEHGFGFDGLEGFLVRYRDHRLQR